MVLGIGVGVGVGVGVEGRFASAWGLGSTYNEVEEDTVAVVVERQHRLVAVFYYDVYTNKYR